MAKLVIFVDDSATVLMSAEMATEDLVLKGSIEIKTYPNPFEVLAAVEKGLVYDLLVTDINMPQMNGLDLCAKLKTIPSVKAKPILALTTENSPDMKQKGKQVGLLGWITKPFTNQKLLSAITRVLRV